MDDFLCQMQSDELSFMNYIEYLEANGLMLDEYGNEVPKDKNMTRSLNYNEDDNE